MEEQEQSRKSWCRPSKSQTQSFFFTHLAVEIRCMVYEYVLAIPDICSKSYVRALPVQGSPDSSAHSTLATWLLRPRKHSRVRRLDRTSLLRLCQSIYDEALPFVVRSTVHHLIYPWMCRLRPPRSIAREYLKHMTWLQVSQIKVLHLFVGPPALQARDSGGLETASFGSRNPLRDIAALHCARLGGQEIAEIPLYPDLLTITIRHEDWSLGNDGYFLKDFLNTKHWTIVFHHIRRLSIEIEVESQWKYFQAAVIAELRGFVFDTGNGSRLVPEGDVHELEWVVSTPEKVVQRQTRARTLQKQPAKERRYTVYKFFWQSVTGGDTNESKTRNTVPYSL